MVFSNKQCNQVIISILCLFLISCQNRVFEKAVAQEGATKEYLVDLSRLPFQWESVYFFQGDYSDNEIETIIKARLSESTDIAYFVVVFIANGKVVYEESWYHMHHYKHYFSISRNDRGYDSLSINSPFIKVRPMESRIGFGEWYEMSICE